MLLKGADWLVDGALELAGKHRVSVLVIGLTIVAFGTTFLFIAMHAGKGRMPGRP